MARFVAQVPLRWTDQDAYRHVNHARTVTLLEEARIGLFFDLAGEEGIDGFERGFSWSGCTSTTAARSRTGSRRCGCR